MAQRRLGNRPRHILVVLRNLLRHQILSKTIGMSYPGEPQRLYGKKPTGERERER
jgi:hypothetical protein